MFSLIRSAFSDSISRLTSALKERQIREDAIGIPVARDMGAQPEPVAADIADPFESPAIDLPDSRTIGHLNQAAVNALVEADKGAAPIVAAAELTPIELGKLRLSDGMRAQAEEMPEYLFRRKKDNNPEDYTFIRTLATRLGGDDGTIRKIQRRYARNLDDYRITTTAEGAIPGYRRVAVIGPEFAQIGNTTSVLGVDNDGLFFIAGVSHHDTKGLSLAETIDMAFNGNEEERVGPASFSLNRHSKNYVARCNLGVLGLSNAATGDGDIDIGDSRFKPTFTALIRNRINQDMGIATATIRAALDPDLARVMNANLLHNTDELMWLSGGAMDSENRKAKSVARVQACLAYPVLSRHFMESRTLTQAIDERRPLAELLARTLDIPLSGIKALQGLTWQRMGGGAYTDLSNLRRIGRIRYDLVPGNKAEFRRMDRLVSIADTLNINADVAIEHHGRTGAPWRPAASGREPSASELTDFIEYLTDKLFEPAANRRLRNHPDRAEDHILYVIPDMRETIRKVVFSTLSVKELVDGSERWHRNIERHSDQIQTFSRDRKWSSLIGDIDLGNGVTARELSSSLSLVNQGSQEGHCVGGYDTHILDSNIDSSCLIFSIERDGKVLSTCEIRIDNLDVSVEPNGNAERLVSHEAKVSVRQNFAQRNTDPGAEARSLAAAITRHVGALPFARLREWHQGLRSVPRGKDASLPKTLMRFGFSPWDDASMQNAWNELSQYLPRGIRKAGLEAFEARMDETLRDIFEMKDLRKVWFEWPEANAIWSAEKTVIDQILERRPIDPISMMVMTNGRGAHTGYGVARDMRDFQVNAQEPHRLQPEPVQNGYDEYYDL